MIVPIIVIIGMGFSVVTRDPLYVAIAAAFGVLWHEMLLWDIHGHLYRIEEWLNERGINLND